VQATARATYLKVTGPAVLAVWKEGGRGGASQSSGSCSRIRMMMFTPERHLPTSGQHGPAPSGTPPPAQPPPPPQTRETQSHSAPTPLKRPMLTPNPGPGSATLVRPQKAPSMPQDRHLNDHRPRCMRRRVGVGDTGRERIKFLMIKPEQAKLITRRTRSYFQSG